MLWVKPKPSTWQDEEDSRNKSQDGAMWSDVADVTEYKTNEHEEEADQRKRCGRTDHLWNERRETRMKKEKNWSLWVGLNEKPALVNFLFFYIVWGFFCIFICDFLKLLMEGFPLRVAAWGFLLRLVLFLMELAFHGFRSWFLIYMKMELDLPTVSKWCRTSKK